MKDADGSSPADAWDREASKRVLDELFTLTDRYRQSESYFDLLEFIARFKRYSPYNAMLAHIQKQGATYVLTASRSWREYRALSMKVRHRRS